MFVSFEQWFKIERKQKSQQHKSQHSLWFLGVFQQPYQAQRESPGDEVGFGQKDIEKIKQ